MTRFSALRFGVALAIALPAATAAHAASFDCAAARSAIERAICNDAQLSALDSQLASAYQAALKTPGNDADQLKADQRAWLRARTPDGKIDLPTLQNAYRERVAALQALAPFPAPNAPVAGPTFRLTSISTQHDFVLRMLGACPAEKGDRTTCSGPGQLLINGKGQRAVRQTINLPNVFVTLPDGGSVPLVNSARLYDDQGVINVGDFNFDGYDDFGIQAGNEGSYGGPSYDVYLFDPKTARFVHNDAMTQLIQETLGFFEVDAKQKRLRTLAKSGCCYHETTTYRVERDTPVAIARHIEDGMAAGNKMKIVDETLVNGTWRQKVRYERMQP